jgi:hypothetical protein
LSLPETTIVRSIGDIFAERSERGLERDRLHRRLVSIDDS